MKMNFKLLAFALAIGAANVQAITLAEVKSVVGDKLAGFKAIAAYSALAVKEKGNKLYSSSEVKAQELRDLIKKNKKQIAVLVAPVVFTYVVGTQFRPNIGKRSVGSNKSAVYGSLTFESIKHTRNQIPANFTGTYSFLNPLLTKKNI